ncbi:MAG: NAD(+) synthase [Desulfovibrio sp.]|nr:NAD(+) synthase [Desulfovibrio sp.]
MRYALLQCSFVPCDITGNVARLLELAGNLPSDLLCLLPADWPLGTEAGSLATNRGCLAGLQWAFARLAESGRSFLLTLPSVEDQGIPKAVLVHRGRVFPLSVSPEKGRSVFSLSVNEPHAETLFCIMLRRDRPGREPLFDWKDLSVQEDATAIILLSAEPFFPAQSSILEAWYADGARLFGRPLLALHRVGGEGGLVFSGQSCGVTPEGSLSFRARAFAEDSLLFELPALPQSVVEGPRSKAEALWGALVLGTRDFVETTGVRRVFIGLSGGMDSALVATIAVAALGPSRVTPVLMPSPYTAPSSLADARELASRLGVSPLFLPITPLMEVYKTSLAECLSLFPAGEGDVTFENIQARIRGTLLCALANRGCGVVLNTGNKSEAAVGYSTLYGDTVGALAVIGDITKSEVYELGEWYCKQFPSKAIPAHVLSRAPSAELRENQKDSDTLPEYSQLDPEIERLFGGDPVDSSLARDVERRVLAAEFKRRQEPPVLMVSESVFGVHWRIPLSKRVRFLPTSS